MISASPLPDHLWNNASAELRSAILALVQIHQEQVAALETRINDLEARLKLDSTNSHKPPSSDLHRGQAKTPRYLPPARNAAVSPSIVGPSGSWSRPRKSARPSPASPPTAENVVKDSSATTPRR